jgi:D-serine deaminase-like pyridoxal phosphate-dependent protein
MDVLQLKTPCALVDLDRVERNCARMAQRMEALGATLRPHVKTHKCVEAARLQLRGRHGGITVSTLAEARFFARAGFDDITYAVPLAPMRAAEAVELNDSLTQLQLLVDHPRAVEALDEAASARDRIVRVLLKVDCGYHRSGVQPDDPAALELARTITRSSNLRFAGILTHAGHSYQCADREQIVAVARQERAVAAAFAERLRACDIEVETVSIGSTPTMSVVDDLSGITEVRPGNYVFFDAFQASIGSCTLGDAAFSVLASVIGHYPEDGRLVIDAGALALSKDAGATHLDGEPGYGVVCDLDGKPLAGLTLTSLSQEHGIVRGPSATIEALSLGSRLRIIANHSCLAAACFDHYQVARGRAVEARWTPTRGW